MDIEDLRELEVKEDKQLLPVEKETYLHISGEDKNRVKVTSNMEPFIKWLLNCDDIELVRYYRDGEGNLIHLEGTLPISYIRFKTNSSDSMNYISRVIA